MDILSFLKPETLGVLEIIAALVANFAIIIFILGIVALALERDYGDRETGVK